MLLVCGLTPATFGQLLPAGIVTGPAPSPSDCTVIDAFIDREVKKLLSSDPLTVSSARGTIIIQASVQGASPGFYTYFADSLNKRLLSLTSNADARIRLNAGIVAARVASKVQNIGLAPVTDEFLRDKTEAVVLWGMQSAKFVVPQLLIAGANAKAIGIGQDVVQAAETYNNAPDIEEAYRTVLLDPGLGNGLGGNLLKQIPAPSLNAFLVEPIALFEYRAKLYDIDVPPQPTADTWAVKFFANQTVWAAASPAQQAQIKQAMLVLLKGAAKQKQNAVGQPKDILDVIVQTGSAFQALGDITRSKPLKDKGHAVFSLTPNSSGGEIDTAIKDLDAIVNPPPPGGP